MARTKRGSNANSTASNSNNGNTTSSGGDSPPHRAPTNKKQRVRIRGYEDESPPRKRRSFEKFGASVGVALIAVVAYFTWQGYLETRVNTPFDAEKVVTKEMLNEPEKFWGTYRPGTYFGLKTRSPGSPIFGMMWMSPSQYKSGDLPLRHWCEQGDNLERYGWTEHDGTNFGVQELIDGEVKITTSFVKDPHAQQYGLDWTARIRVEQSEFAHRNTSQVYLFFYGSFEEGHSGWMKPIYADDSSSNTRDKKRSRISGMRGFAPSVGDFRLNIFTRGEDVGPEFSLSGHSPGPHMISQFVKTTLRQIQPGIIGLPGSVAHLQDPSATPDFVAYQVVGATPFEIEVVYRSSANSPRSEIEETFSGPAYDTALKAWREKFNKKFEEKFHLAEKGFSSEQIRFAKAAMSNMVGGVGYFYGSSLVQSPYNKDPVFYWPAGLYTAVPSRSFFPRGFLWDEGFHNLLIAQWDRSISKEIVAHWLDLLNVEGWIPREQILGIEALQRVPQEFVVQRNTNANPPTLVLTLYHLLQTVHDSESPEVEEFQYFDKLWPRLVAWYQWFNTTQVGTTPGTYRWRGRDSTTTRELNPKTLTSGLDDYPRASHPSDDERHLDLRCWMAMASKLMGEIAVFIQRDPKKFISTYEYLKDDELLDALHWSPSLNAYADYGLHSNDVALKREPRAGAPPAPGRPPPPPPGLIRYTRTTPQNQFVDSFGYVSLFPLMLEILDPSSPRLGQLLFDLKNEDLLWTPYGLRSLAKKAPLYMKRNTEHDPPYWRGPIWINMNFLVVRGLKSYASVDGPYKKMAAELYEELRRNVINNVFREYHRTGYIWEQYNDATGKGQGCRPFTGWSSLVVLMMSETF